jgi:hypothetical protein
MILYRVSTESIHVRSKVLMDVFEFYEFAIVVARVHSAASMVGGRGFNLCCSI